MAGDSNTALEVDVNTENLDDFSDLFLGKVKASEVEEGDETLQEDTTEAPEAEDAEDSGAEDEEVVEAEPLDETDEDEDILKVKKPKKLVQERIDELTRKAREAERREAEVRRELEEFRARQSQDEKKDEPRRGLIANDGPDPDAVDEKGNLLYPLGEFDPLYIRDMNRFFFAEENKAFQERQAQEQEARERDNAMAVLQTQWDGRLKETEKALPDLRPTLAKLENSFRDLESDFGSYLFTTIQEMDAGPEVLYYLANNLEEADEIVAAGPRRATLMLGKLEARIQNALSKKDKDKAARVSQAPKPPVANRGTGPRLSVPDDTDNLDDFEAKFFNRKK